MVHGHGQISEAELAAFADGSLSPRRRARVAAPNHSVDSARRHTGESPPPDHLAA